MGVSISVSESVGHSGLSELVWAKVVELLLQREEVFGRHRVSLKSVMRNIIIRFRIFGDL